MTDPSKFRKDVVILPRDAYHIVSAMSGRSSTDSIYATADATEIVSPTSALHRRMRGLGDIHLPDYDAAASARPRLVVGRCHTSMYTIWSTLVAGDY